MNDLYKHEVGVAKLSLSHPCDLWYKDLLALDCKTTSSMDDDSI